MTTAILDADLILNAAELALPQTRHGAAGARVGALIAMARAVPRDTEGFRRISISLDDFMLISRFTAKQPIDRV